MSKCSVEYEVQIQYDDGELAPDGEKWTRWATAWVLRDQLPKDHPDYREAGDGWVGDTIATFSDLDVAVAVCKACRQLAIAADLDDRRYRVVRLNTREIPVDD